MLTYTKDKNNEDILLDSNNEQVMMEWEKSYMEACIDFLQPKGDVLEIGFGMGYSATQIQKYKPKSYTIVECDPVVIEKCKEWAKDYDNVTIIESTWQDAFQNKSYGVYDKVFFDDFVLEYNNNKEQGGFRIKLFVQLLQEYKLIRDKGQLSFYMSCEPSDENIDFSREIYENIRSVNNPGKWTWEHETFDVKVSKIAEYHFCKNQALIPLITFNQHG